MAMIVPRGPFVATCPTRLLLDQIADKWSVLVLISVSSAPIRFNRLKRTVEGISQKVLTQTLRRLEANGLVRRDVFATVPIIVRYEITDLGRSLSMIVDQLRRWAIDNMREVEVARTMVVKAAVVAGPSGCRVQVLAAGRLPTNPRRSRLAEWDADAVVRHTARKKPRHLRPKATPSIRPPINGSALPSAARS